jgi:mannose-6-phosphate isomerase-like protein (cupin superfamily)
MKYNVWPAVSIAFIFLTIVLFGIAQTQQEGYVLEREAAIRHEEPGPHEGGGKTVAYPYFAKVPGLKVAFRKRVLYPGSSIGYHLQEKEEIYYIVQGRGEMNMNGKTFAISAGDAVLTHPGNRHGLKPVGSDSLTVIINYLLD